MTVDARMLYIHALSPIHSGTGQSTDVIDLPVAREKVTGWPVLPGSSIKGVLRDACATVPNADAKKIKIAFGPDTQNASEHAGALAFTDGHLLCLAVRSLAGSFAWVTCPLALRRWRRDHERAGLDFAISIPEPFSFAVQDEPEALAILVDQQDAAIGQDGLVYLEDLDLHLQPHDAVGQIAAAIAKAVFETGPWIDFFKERFGIISDDVFSFLADTATEVSARVKLDDKTKTVQRGHLWYEEAVPAESIFSGPIVAMLRNTGDAEPLFETVAAWGNGLLQIGGCASVGRGLIEVQIQKGITS